MPAGHFFVKNRKLRVSYFNEFMTDSRMKLSIFTKFGRVIRAVRFSFCLSKKQIGKACVCFNVTEASKKHAACERCLHYQKQNQAYYSGSELPNEKDGVFVRNLEKKLRPTKKFSIGRCVKCFSTF